jgi:hypothetical protein
MEEFSPWIRKSDLTQISARLRREKSQKIANPQLVQENQHHHPQTRTALYTALAALGIIIVGGTIVLRVSWARR